MKKGSLSGARLADNIVTYAVLIVVSLVFLFPCVWLIAASFSKSGDLHSFSGFFPKEFSVQTFVDLFTDDVNGLYPYKRWFRLSPVVAQAPPAWRPAQVLSAGPCAGSHRRGQSAA